MALLLLGLGPASAALPPGHRREAVAALAVVAQQVRAHLAPAMRGDREQFDADDHGGVQAGGPRQRPGAQGTFFARHSDWMAGSGSMHGPVQFLDCLCVALAGLSRWKVGVRILPDRNGSRPAEQGKREARQTQQGDGLCATGSKESMRCMERRPEQQTRRTKATATLAIALAVQQSLLLEVAQKDSQIVLHPLQRDAVLA